MRPYNSEADYPLILEAARASGETSIAAIAAFFEPNGIVWPVLNPSDGKPSPEANAVDHDICLAWSELGYHPKGGAK